MVQHDYEQQPEAPDIAAVVQEDTAETLIGPPGADPLDAGYVPPDQPYVLDDDTITAAGQRHGESLDDRLRREQPEQTFEDTDRSGRIAIAGGGPQGETPDAIEGIDEGIDGGAASAEEAAVHVINTWIEPVDDERPKDDPEVTASLAEDPHADQAIADAARDAGLS
jgi:Family of unknown function (DUF5709)